MLTKNQIQFIRSLERKKSRVESLSFVAEGNKLVEDLWSTFHCRLLVATKDWLATHPAYEAAEVVVAERSMLHKASHLVHAQEVIAVFGYDQDAQPIADPKKELVLALDGVQDPGNVGTILRIADWYGIRQILCTAQCADVYSPKVVQASMGAIARVRCKELDLVSYLQAQPGVPIYGTLLNGKNIYQSDLENRGILVMGNEGKGLSQEVQNLITQALYLPNFPEGQPTSESLNVAMATAITCAEFRRRIISESMGASAVL